MTTSATTSPPSLARTPFHRFHVEHGAKLVDFAGWEMPILYTSIIEEHKQVRSSGGLFDVSHMGRLRFSGRDALRFLDHVCTRAIADMTAGQCRYSLVCNERGGCRDDVLVYRLDESEFIMVCNASNRPKLLDHFAQVKGPMVFKLVDETTTTAMIAIQGPKVMDLIAKVSSEIPTLKRYRFVEKSILFKSFLISRTGYTGEDGVEVILPASIASLAVQQLLPEGDDVKPIGLGARDTLRLEAGMPLYGHELTEDIDPLSAGLAFAVKLEKETPFIGQEALRKFSAAGTRRTLVGLRVEGKRSPRPEMKVLKSGREIGFVTSGCLSPTLERPIAMTYIDSAEAAPGTSVQVDLGRAGAVAEAQVVKLPFYKAQ
jgi:aminomethyltransferase